MTLYKRGRIWWSNFVRNGIRHQTSTRATDRRTAERIEEKLKNDVALRLFGIIDFDPNLTFSEIAERFKKTNPAKYTLDRLQHLLPFFGPMRISEITRNRAAEYRTIRKEEKPNLKDATLNKDVGVLRHVLYWAQGEKLIPSNPVARVPMARVRRIARPVMSVEEEERILAVAPEHLQNVIIGALDTGMRRKELFSERWEDIDFNRDLLTVTHSKTPEGEAREIPFTSRFKNLLASVPKEERVGLIFTYQGNAVLDLKTSWNTAQEKAGFTRHYRFHDLRHCFNTRLMEAGVIADVRMAIMGHEAGTIHAGYTHVEPPAKREAIKKLERWVSKEKNKKKSII
ncbi:MAG TPA: site-specific integrase [Candidatus Sulfotelmatobacter sp.]|nr:site-specific integrase [Candidatus Sulfotelmatobacter sp.]